MLIYHLQHQPVNTGQSLSNMGTGRPASDLCVIVTHHAAQAQGGDIGSMRARKVNKEVHVVILVLSYDALPVLLHLRH